MVLNGGRGWFGGGGFVPGEHLAMSRTFLVVTAGGGWCLHLEAGDAVKYPIMHKKEWSSPKCQ